MIKKNQRRIMRDGTVVTVLAIFNTYDSYWKRETPHVRLAHPDGQIVRKLGTVNSYPLEANYRKDNMADNDPQEIKEYPVTCPHCGVGTLEASTRIFLNVEQARVDDDGAVHLIDINVADLNDWYNGQPLNVESELELNCDNCSRVIDWDITDEFRSKTAAQPIGDAPRTYGKRGGMPDGIED